MVVTANLGHAFVQRRRPTMIVQSRSTTTTRCMFDFLKPKDPEKAKEEPKEEEAVDFSDDPVDKIFGFFFGAKEAEPMGMKRFGRGAWLLEECVCLCLCLCWQEMN
jgi:hypothetical protein